MDDDEEKNDVDSKSLVDEGDVDPYFASHGHLRLMTCLKI